MEYWMIFTTDYKGNKGLGQGMMTRQSLQQQGIANYFDVKSVQEYFTKVEQLGGKVLKKRQCLAWVILLYVQIQRGYAAHNRRLVDQDIPEHLIRKKNCRWV
jgi:hypothetical protein